MPKYADFPNNCGRAPNYCRQNTDGSYAFPTIVTRLRYPTNYLDTQALYFTPFTGVINTVNGNGVLTLSFIKSAMDVATGVSEKRCAMTDIRTSYPIWRPDAFERC
jgi:hypothetical protein